MLLRIKLLFSSIIITVLFIFILPVFAQTKNSDSHNIVVNLPSRTIALYAGASLIKEYPVAIGKISTPTPLGDFFVVSKEINPSWYPPDNPGEIVPTGPANPLGYRWLGFIANEYGIHGTNEPWSIGAVVSNGCLRMHEPDVEELFDLVEYGTPVKITYDLEKIFTDETGKIKISIYDDVYGYGKPTIASIRKQLEKHSLNAFVTDDALKDLLAENNERPVDIAKTVQIKINGKKLSELGVVTQETTYVPIKPVADSLGKSFFFDGQYVFSLLTGNKKIPAIVSDDMVYVSVKDIEILFGGRQSLQDNNTCWSFDKTIVFFNEKPTTLEAVKIGEMPALPINELAKVLNRTGHWDADSQIFFLEVDAETSPIPIKADMIGSNPFLLITKINEYFDTFVYWNVQDNGINLIYPIP